MNVEGDFRYVDSGAYDECLDFLAYLDDGFKNDWENAFVGWIGASEKRREERKWSQNQWGPWNLVKVLKVFHLVDDHIIRCGNALFDAYI